MRIRNIIAVIPSLALLCACQSEAPQVDNAPKRVITVRAFLPDSDNTRSHITYGNTEIDREIFKWHPFQNDPYKDDYIAVFNITRLSECPDGIELAATKIDGNSAVFESTFEDDKFQVKAGDLLFINYWNTKRGDSIEGKDVFKIELKNNTQLISDTPYDSTYMSYMQGELKMYDIVTVVKDDSIPDIHFKHLSAIIRITLHNETDSEETKGVFWPKEIKFDYPGTESFFNNCLYCSIDSDSEDGWGLKIHPNPDGSVTYTDSVKSDFNNYTAAVEAVNGTSLKKGQTYNLYLSCVPRFANEVKDDTLIITLQKRLSSEKNKPYTMTLEDFNVPIEAGKRYWFNLTAFDDEDGTGKLMLTSDWLKQQEQNQGSGEETSSGD